MLTNRRKKFKVNKSALLFSDYSIMYPQLALQTNKTNIPIAKLNIFPSRRADDSVDDPCVAAAALLRTGNYCVIAMSYSLHVHAAQQFVPASYNSSKNLISNSNNNTDTTSNKSRFYATCRNRIQKNSTLSAHPSLFTAQTFISRCYWLRR